MIPRALARTWGGASRTSCCQVVLRAARTGMPAWRKVTSSVVGCRCSWGMVAGNSQDEAAVLVFGRLCRYLMIKGPAGESVARERSPEFVVLLCAQAASMPPETASAAMAATSRWPTASSQRRRSRRRAPRSVRDQRGFLPSPTTAGLDVAASATRNPMSTRRIISL